MKLFLILTGIAMAGLLGYRMEPVLQSSLTGITSMNTAEKSRLQAETQVPTVDPATLTPEQLPAKVTLKADVKVTDAASEVTMTIPSGNRVKLVRIMNTNAVVSPGEGPYAGSLPIAQTDLMEQLAAHPPAAVTPPATPATPATPSTPTPEPNPVTPTTPAPTGTPENPVVTTPTDTQPAPVVQPTPDPAPLVQPAPTTPAPVPVTEPAAGTAGSDDVVKVMQASLRAGQIKVFTLDQVQEWKAEPNEKVLGETFQTGSVSYKEETIFGVKTFQVKAYVKDGKVQRWIWLKSGQEIK